MITELDRMAREAGLPVVGVWVEGGELATHASPELRKFAALVAERCAQIAEAHQWWDESGQHSSPEDQHKAVAEKTRAAFKERP